MTRPKFLTRLAAAALLGLLVLPVSRAQAPAPEVPLPPADRLDKRPVEEPANPALPTVFLIGDSTVRNGSDDGQGKGAQGMWGWGHMLPAYFDLSRVNVVNRAVGGLSSRTYLTGGFWAKVLLRLKAGDCVIMQFGHNDAGPFNDEPPGPLRARGTIKGIGEETKEIDNVLTKKHEVVHSYGWYLRTFINDAKARGATPIVCSPIPRKTWGKDGLIERNAATYGGWAAQVAAREKVGFIDLNRIIADAYDRLGHDQVVALFPQVSPDEHTHTDQAGAELNARCVVAGLKLLSATPLDHDLSAKGRAVSPSRPEDPAGLPPS